MTELLNKHVTYSRIINPKNVSLRLMSGLAVNIFKIALDLGEFQVTRKTFGYKFI